MNFINIFSPKWPLKEDDVAHSSKQGSYLKQYFIAVTALKKKIRVWSTSKYPTSFVAKTRGHFVNIQFLIDQRYISGPQL